MTILNYEDTIQTRFGTVYYTGRDASINEVILTNKESKSSYSVSFTDFSTSLYVDFGSFIDALDINKDSTFSISFLSSDGLSLYRDIVVFDERIDSKSDYTQNEESGTGYVFG